MMLISGPLSLGPPRATGDSLQLGLPLAVGTGEDSAYVPSGSESGGESVISRGKRSARRSSVMLALSAAQHQPIEGIPGEKEGASGLNVEVSEWGEGTGGLSSLTDPISCSRDS